MESILFLLQSPAFIAFATGLGLKGIEKSGELISEGAVTWFSNLFIKNGEPKNNFQRYLDAPDNEANQNMMQAIIENSIEDNPESKQYLEEFFKTFSENKLIIKDSKNVNTGNVNTGGGDFSIGDTYGK
ncbi:hypothetical protein [Chryseobacterium gleum]|uniref:hypothetical protein n=1 Tax=Chryseobacterium gleum TaxID=250 RepID=UPI001E29321E|nr:hypothetical protein [Chryseobacterium gleum]MCD9617904.1 hypothetical protein [Chryseobacterium gleum]